MGTKHLENVSHRSIYLIQREKEYGHLPIMIDTHQILSSQLVKQGYGQSGRQKYLLVVTISGYHCM